MKSLFKVTLLATTMAVALNAPLAMAAETTAAPADAAQAAPQRRKMLPSKRRPAVSLCAGRLPGRYMDNSLKEQEKLGIKLDKDQLIAGVQDAFGGKASCLTKIEQTLQAFEGRVKGAAQANGKRRERECRQRHRLRGQVRQKKGVKNRIWPAVSGRERGQR